MAIDIKLGKGTGVIKNGTIVVAAGPFKFEVLDTYVDNDPVISLIESKYDARFDFNYQGSYPPAGT
jgi:hypothetical protein